MSNASINNGLNDITLQKFTSVILNVDLGGGAYSSVGQNRSFGNIGKDLLLNYGGGGAVFAQNNWWGNASGLLASRVTYSASTTANTIPFLPSDPGP